jgi:hypothetical protein
MIDFGAGNLYDRIILQVKKIKYNCQIKYEVLDHRWQLMPLP